MNTAWRLFRMVKTDLKEKVGSISGLSQSDIYRMYAKMPKDNDGLSRDESTFYAKVWPLMEQERKRDKQIQAFERMQLGREVPVWTLK